jgi:succinate dehydrogenase / fumarate reductase cytochrome b subunit
LSYSINNRHFLLRRLHSLFGVAPLGFFLMFHLWENSQSRFGAEHYNEKVVGFLQGMNYLPFIEIGLITLPLLFHSLYGLLITSEMRPQPQRYPLLHNRLYLLQRISGIGILLFLLLHLGGTRFQTLVNPSLSADLFGHLQALLLQPWILWLYIIGLLLSVFHLANGLWGFCITWGITTSPVAQRRAFILFMGVGLLLAAIGLHGIWGFIYPAVSL